MSYTPFAFAESLRIGTLDFVSPDELKVVLDIEAPDSVALNAGAVRPFPRVNGYALVPVDDGYLVGQVEWLTIERSSFPKRRGVQDFGLIDLPYPLRKLRLNPLGTLRRSVDETYSFRRGVEAYPTVGAAVLLPTEAQLRSIVESGARRRVQIGISPLAGSAEVAIDPDKLFGRHIAILGNTGSGKSCSVAGIIRWSLEAARRASHEKARPNARFIVLDPNGEYARAFSDGTVSARVFSVNNANEDLALQVPLWFWKSSEWSSFTQASARTQRPLLRRALREVKSGRTPGDQAGEEHALKMRRSLSSSFIQVRRDLDSSAIKTDSVRFGRMLKAMDGDLRARAAQYPEHGLERVIQAIEEALETTYSPFPDKQTGRQVEYYKPFEDAPIQAVVDAFLSSLETFGGIIYHEGPDEDVPLRFRGVDLADHLEVLAEQENLTQYVDFLVSRIRTFLSDSRIKAVVGEDRAITLAEWLSAYIGETDAANGEVTIIDLSLVPSEVIHVVIAVAARMIFESLQRYRKLNGATLPTVLVMEEAHTFIKRYRDDVDDTDAATLCAQVFERIAREGRKFGLGLVISSQRPSELSPTVLSQCNSFLLHRISNDRDQELVQRLVPDNLRGLLRELPSLPSQHAILLGWATELPVLVRMNDLKASHQPRSDDPDFWHVWTKKDHRGAEVVRAANWSELADEWQGLKVDPVETPQE